MSSSSGPELVDTTAFALTPEGGNACPVVLGADSLSSEEMLAIAADRQLESAFVLRATRTEADVRLRYFVPNHEMEMCVHATIGALTVLRARRVVTADTVAVETAIGLVDVTVRETADGSLPTVRVEQRAPLVDAVDVGADELAAVLGLGAESLDLRLPVENVSTARAKLMVPLRDHTDLDSVDPDLERLWSLCDRVETTGVYAFTTSARNPAAAAEARQFPVRAGYPEDPATGVAACALGAYLSRHTPADSEMAGERSFRIEQGHAMGRPSVLTARTRVERGVVRRTWIEGTATIGS